MTWADAAVLGIVQGLTEFLPVSSSGHLVLVQHLLGIRTPQLVFDIAVHLGTLLAVVWVMRREVADVLQGVARWPEAIRELRQGRKPGQPASLAAWVAIGTLPAAAAGLLFSDVVESWFGSPRLVAGALAVTGVVLWAAGSTRPRSVGLYDSGAPRALAVGLAQAVALIPGISRSGATVAAGLWCGLNSRDAARFSFLLSVPAIAGAALVGAWKASVGQFPAPPPGQMAVGIASAALTGYVAISGLFEVLRRGRLRWFSVYLWSVALATWLLT